MIRRVATVARRGLFVLGMVLLLWTPLSYFIVVDSRLPVGSATVVDAFALRSAFVASIKTAPGAARARNARLELVPVENPQFTLVLVPTVSIFAGPGYRTTLITIPLWLLAAACLAWPVTSLFVRRRREGRGFAVVEADAGETRDPDPR